MLRLLASVFICVFFLSTTATSVLRFFTGGRHQESPGLLLAASLGSLGLLLGALFLLRQPWSLDRFARNLALLLFCVYAGFFLMWLGLRAQGLSPAAQNVTIRVVIAVLSFQGAALVLVHFFLRQHGVGWIEGFGLDRHPRHALSSGLALGMAAVPVCWGLQMLSGMLMDGLRIPAVEQESVQLLRAAAHPLNRVLLGVTAIVLAPVAEEVLFRGLLYPAIKQAGFPRLALWLTALLFAAIHLNLATLLPLVMLALALAWLYERTNNLLAPVVAHSLFNTVNFVMIFVADSLGPLPAHK